MNTRFVQASCQIVMLSVNARLGSRNNSKEKGGFIPLTNLGLALCLGILFAPFKVIFTHQALHRRFALIPSAISLTTSGLTYLARKNDLFSQEMEAVEQNLEKWMMISNRILSIALLILLSPQASQTPLDFSLPVLLEGVETGTTIWNFLKARSTVK